MRIAVFAFYDKKGLVHEYVQSYLAYLKEVADKVILIADNEAEKSEQNKLKGLVNYAQFQKHEEYDFGSYKRGIQYAEKKGWLAKADELILCNDSCFCISSLKPAFDIMSQKRCDFWGMSANNEVQPHLQSFFLVFKKKTFTSKVFKNFMQSVQKQSDVLSVVYTYEIPFKDVLNRAGFKDMAYFGVNDKFNPTVQHNIQLIKDGFPLLKKKIFTELRNAKESRRKILKAVKSISQKSYQDICLYYKNNFSCFFPFIIPTDLKHILRFLYKKKITKSGKTIIKICKIPIYRRKK